MDTALALGSRSGRWPALVGYHRDRWDGGRLRDRREAAGLSREYLAHLLGSTTRTIERWESGETVPSPEAALVLGALLTVDAAAFFRPLDLAPAGAVG